MSTRDDELSRETLAALVAAADPDWRLREARPATHGTDAVHHLTVDTGDGPRDLVSKARTERDRSAFRAEPRLLDAVGRRSSVPVPEVLALVETPDLPDSFLMERLPGETITDPVDELDPELLDRIAFDAGRFLGSIAGVGDFDRFGELHLAAELDDPRVGISGPDDDLAVPGDSPTAWRERLSGMATYFLDSIAGDSQFGDLVPPLRSFLDERYDRLDGSERPALAHNDYL
jgi:hypothetical protein